ncbi:hypothetical protein GCK32_007799 [Trichostrongylus colubriformis]|uniref:Uncharacterized protein n=1 Tax=Trichostrongylus colubriformis TaxID=6319 RepID=A0AAN8FHI3_TRICO
MSTGPSWSYLTIDLRRQLTANEMKCYMSLLLAHPPFFYHNLWLLCIGLLSVKICRRSCSSS